LPDPTPLSFSKKQIKRLKKAPKKTKHVQELFSLPPDDSWIEDYTCAIERGILWHGRMYITQNNLCFHANILGKITKEIVPWAAVRAIEKDAHGLINPSIIVYSEAENSTTYNRQYFTSFVSRDTSYEQILKVWHPELFVPADQVCCQVFLK
jgi:hypothetical protein